MATAVGGARGARHVVDDRIYVHLDTGPAAGVDHRLEVGLFAHPAGQVVVDRLVDLPPGMDWGRAAARVGILRRSDLNAPVAGGSQDVGALLSDRLPVPLEQVGDDVALASSLLPPARLLRRGAGRSSDSGET